MKNTAAASVLSAKIVNSDPLFHTWEVVERVRMLGCPSRTVDCLPVEGCDDVPPTLATPREAGR